MRTEGSPAYQRDPFFKRVGTDIIDWFKNKGLRIKERFLTYIKSKETKKMWIRRGIIVGIILLIVLSFRVVDFVKVYPFDQNSYLITDAQRSNMTAYNGSSGINRIADFFLNCNSGEHDAIRLTWTENGYTIIQDIECEDGIITVTTDNRKNKLLPESQRVKTTEIYTECVVTVVASTATRTYKLIRQEDGITIEYKLAEQSLK